MVVRSDIPKLPDNAYNAVYDSMLHLGFPSKGILDDYKFSFSKDVPLTVNTMVFAHEKRRDPTEYASFTVYHAVNGADDGTLVNMLAETAAPFHLIHRGETFSFWASTLKHNKVEPIPIESDIAYDHLDNVLHTYAVDLNPQRIVGVKQGRDRFVSRFFQDVLQPLQLAMWAANVTGQLLVQHFGEAIQQLRHNTPKAKETIVVDIATQLLGAKILADTGGFGDDIRLQSQQIPLDTLIHTAHAHFPTYFHPQLFETHEDSALHTHQILQEICFSGFAPSYLIDLYTAAYDATQRKNLGRYDTPLFLTRRIWDNIPIEFLPPEERIVADMTCGWGSFLIAGYDRLSRLSDMRHRTLRDYLYGNDKDYLTARLAGLGLLTTTSRDSWHIDHADALSWNWLTQHQPNIIVGNPPFGGDRKTITSTQSEGKRLQRADNFLQKALERLAPGGYLALLMPSSFVASESSPALRKQLLETCDVQEIWDFPEGVFRGPQVRVVVLFAQKRKNAPLFTSLPVRTRIVQAKTLESFAETGMFTASSLSRQDSWNEQSRKSPSSENSYIMDYKLTLSDQSWDEICNRCATLQEQATVFVGAIAGSPSRHRWKDYPDPKEVPWLTQARKIMPHPFCIVYNHASTIIYPNNLEEPRKSHNPQKDYEKLFTGTKVLVVSLTDPTWGKRVKVAIERRGHYVSDSFFVVVPKIDTHTTSWSYEVLAAILHWHVSNAWVVEHLKHPKIPIRILRTIPVPRHISENDCNALTNAVLKLEQAAQDDEPPPVDAHETIDTILKHAYQLDDATFERLRLISEWDNHEHISLDPPPSNASDWYISGEVESIDTEAQTITLWMDGFDDFQTVPIVPAMPGWILRPGTLFCTEIPDRCERQKSLTNNTDWGTFIPQEFAYMDEESLLEDLSELVAVK